MKLTNENILIASLLGSKVVEKIPRFEKVANYMETHVGVPIPFLPIRNEVKIDEVDGFDVGVVGQGPTPLSVDQQFFPFSFKKPTEAQWYTLPWEPMISIEGRNKVARRYVAKQGANNIGSVKERFSTDDFDITITGTLFGLQESGKPVETYPKDDMQRLREYLISAESLQILSEPLQILGINRIVVDSMSFPFTKGENVQAYEIKAWSDFDFQLLIEE